MTVTAMADTHAADDERWRIEPLFDAPGRRAAPRRTSAARLARRYGADLAIALRADRPTIVSNFVSTIDGVVAFDTDGRTGGREVSGASDAGSLPDGPRPRDGRMPPRRGGDGPLGQAPRWTPGLRPPAVGRGLCGLAAELGLAPQPTDGHRHAQRRRSIPAIPASTTRASPS